MQNHAAELRQLSQVLSAHKADWQFLPFDRFHWPWPELAFVTDLEPDALEAMGVAEHLALVRRVRPALAPWLAMSLPRLPQAQLKLPPRIEVGMPGRKWAQVRDFAGAISPLGPVLEWCAGKGHLGRLLASQGQRVTAIEWQAELCRQGEAEAQRWQLPHSFVCADALAPDSSQFFKQDIHAVALHACGELHLSLLRQASSAGAAAISLSPCCYHLIKTERYQPLSRVGREGDLGLTPFDLRLPLQEQVTGGARIARLRHTEQHYRLAFDALQRQLLGRDSYLPVPPAPQSLFSGPFADFAAWAAGQKGLALPAGIDLAPCLARGAERQRFVRQLEWVRHWYRWPLELWLLLDRVCFLEEQGYEVRLGTFTDKHNSPRNALIDARRGDA
ncbi:methyltransferase [Gallaecimonas kandeliae]|uniref:methyltransferase n=1 Tax=Gallaecimonas kandeliae TaxID=3029055 RepID=UPI002647B59D|nr:methyltransferase [Gallaecimonas kandeliae]WKE63936.1 methyltransferase [Gallaecimonas kandeliae]